MSGTPKAERGIALPNPTNFDFHYKLQIMNAQTEKVTRLTKERFIGGKYKEESYSFFPRFLAAFWGSMVFHFSILIVSSIKYEQQVASVIDDYISLLIYFLYSATFAFIAAFSSKGSLVRHFFSGVVLPASTYWICSIIIWILSSVNSTA